MHTIGIVPKMGLLLIMYILQNIYIGFSWTLIPILMREQGFGLGEIGISVLIYAPWAMKFLYASLIDRFYLPALGRRKSWFGPFMVLVCLGLPLLASLDPNTQLFKVLVVVFLLNLCSSTTDIAVDGYATDILHPDEMPCGNTMQMTGNWTGMLLGSSIFLILYETAGWHQALLIMTGVYCALTLPVLLHREIKSVHNAGDKDRQRVQPHKPSVRRFFTGDTWKPILLFMVLSALVTHGGNRLRLPMLVDQGLNAADVGGLLLYFGAPMGILGALIGGMMIKLLGEDMVYIGGAILSSFAGLWTVWLVGNPIPATWMISVMFAADYLMMGLMMVLIYNLIMRVSIGSQSATNFAVLCSGNHILIFCITITMGFLCEFIGFQRYFWGLVGVTLLVAYPGSYLIRRRILCSE